MKTNAIQLGLGCLNLFSLVANPMFYRTRLFLEDLNQELREKVMKIAFESNYDYKNIQFVRTEFNYFEMRYCGQKTFWGYFIDCNEVD